MRKINAIIKKTIVSFALISSLIITEPIYLKTIQAAEIEDCDLDGYDDHTGNPVPWIGFDSTKGEAIPGDWDHSTTYKSVKAYQDAHTKKEEPKPASGSSSTNTSSSSGTKNTAKTGNSTGSKTTTSNSGSKNSVKKQSTLATKKTSPVKRNAVKKESGKEEKEQGTEEKVEETTEETTEKKDSKKKHKKKHKKAAEVKKTKGSELQDDTEAVEVEEADILVGTINIDEADGSIIHAGSHLIVSGADFEENVEGIEIEIHSKNHIHLGYVNTLEDGSFESQVSIPENLPEGSHEIVLTYQGQVIASKTIQVGAKVADTFLSALTVGFTGDNQGLIPGLLLLAGLFVAGIITLISGKIVEKAKS